MTAARSISIYDSAVRPLSLRQVIEFTGISRASIYFHIKQGTFPRHVKFGRRTFWLSDEVTEWVESLRTARDQGQSIAHFAKACDQAKKAYAGRHKKRRLMPPAERAA